MTHRLTIEVSDEVLSALKQDPDGFAREMRLVAAVKWYEMGAISQGKAAEIAGLSRAEFLFSLARFGVSPFQYGSGELAAELSRG